MTTSPRPLPPSRPMQAPDPILAELWEAKRQINTEAGYDIATLVRMAHAAAKKIGSRGSSPTGGREDKSQA